MHNIKIIIEYDGSDFCGWQIQPQDRTVQGELKKSLKKIIKEDVNIIGSGRTDSGVHASGQVVNFITNSEMDLNKLKSALNGTLPKDIAVLSIEAASMEFHARYDAIKREYCYTISKRKSAINRNFTWHYFSNLDINKIRQASQYMIGEHDFKSFCQSKAEVNHYICNIELIEWSESKDIIELRIIANRFLHNMVRIIVGTMIEIGLGKIKVNQIHNILEAKDRNAAGPTIPAKGLRLVKVYY